MLNNMFHRLGQRLSFSQSFLSRVPATLVPLTGRLFSGNLSQRSLSTRTRYTSNKQKRGIVHSRRATGFNVSHSKRRTRRTFKPNVFWRTLYSEVLDEKVGPLHVSASGLRDLDKCGGLDNYIIKNPYKRVHWAGTIKKIRERILNKVRLDRKWKKRREEAGEVDGDLGSL